MSRKKKFIPKTDIEIPAEIPKDFPLLFPSWSFRLMAILVFVFAFGLYFNTIFNEYALDDGIVITENDFTKKGFSGIADIFSHETFANITGVKDELSGGRYRPLSVATFAIEYGFFGLRPSVSHFINVLLYSILSVLLFYFLRQYVFRNNAPAALIASLLFVVHPLHTDVVSNIKGRDELLSLVLLILCLIFYMEYSIKKKWFLLFASLIAYFLSLLSKENGVTFIAVIPLILYFFMNKKIKDSILPAFPFILVFAGYFLIRLSIAGLPGSTTHEVMNAPFTLASGDQEFATKIMILGKNLWMLAFPHPLSYDYSYNQIAYVHFTDWKCLLSLLINGMLVFLALKLFKKRHLLSFAILFYYITLSVVSNFVFDVGSPFNERFLFQPSIGFSIAVAFLIVSFGTMKPENQFYRMAALLLCIFLLIAGGIKTILRNPEWKNNETLFAADVLHAPNSAKTHNYVAITFLKKGEEEKDSIQKNKFFETAIFQFRRSLEIYPDFADPYINLGNIYARQGKLDMAKENLMKAKAIYPGNTILNINLSYVAGQYEIEASKQFDLKNITAAIKAATSSVECNPESANALYNLGGYYLTLNDVQKARELWTRALALDPGNQTIKSWLDKISTPPLPKN